MEPQITKLLQLGIIVEDVEETIRHYDEDYGIGPWKRSTFDKENFPDLTIDGKPSDMKALFAFCDAFGMEIELIQPVTESAYKTWLDEHGPGLHHIAAITEGGFDKALARHKQLTGKDPWVRGQSSIGMDFAYLDLSKELGLFIELYNEDRSAQPGHPIK
ncbi:VOC family protein [Ruminococcaceae bacterium OttesenSCG-928-D13]|nr:VOC family protein [Ruminococcaceae bacterium OttesenSCG-928-D13]